MKLQSDKIGEFISGIQSKIISATDKHENFDLYSERATYQMLNYPKIFDHLCEFAENYESYHKAGDNKYRDKIITMTQKYVEKIVSDKAYRKDLNIHEFKDQVNAFVDGTLKFQKIIKRIEEDTGSLFSISVCFSECYRWCKKTFRKFSRCKGGRGSGAYGERRKRYNQ